MEPAQVTKLEGEVTQNLPAVEALATQASELKSGFKTSEFWIVLGTDLAALLAGVLPANSIWLKCVSGAVMGLTSLAYLWGRVSLKKLA